MQTLSVYCFFFFSSASLLAYSGVFYEFKDYSRALIMLKVFAAVSDIILSYYGLIIPPFSSIFSAYSAF